MRPLRLGVVGLGRAFTLMLPTFQADARVKLVAACDPREDARRRFAADFAAPTYDTIEALARNADVEALYIASPHQFHAEHTRIAAAHGKHVLVEKPMALELAACDAMIECCRDAKVKLIVGHSHSFDSPYLAARDIIARGELGAIKMIHAINYTDYLYRPRRPEELSTALGGGVLFSQGSHQIEVVRLLAGAPVSRVRAITGAWDPARPTEGAYTALLWFENNAFATITYNGYGHFDTDEWSDWVGELGNTKNPDDYGAARRRLARVHSPAEEARLKNAATYGGPDYVAASNTPEPRAHQHFGSIVVSCAHGDVRPMTDGVWVYRDDKREHLPLPKPTVPRGEVMDELYAALVHGGAPMHDGQWARGTIAVSLSLLKSAQTGADVLIAQ